MWSNVTFPFLRLKLAVTGWRFDDNITISRIITGCTDQVQNIGRQRTVLSMVLTVSNRNTTRFLPTEQRSNAVIMAKRYNADINGSHND